VSTASELKSRPHVRDARKLDSALTAMLNELA
jgi:hypothetical protein